MQDINTLGLEELTNEESFGTIGGGDVAEAIGWLAGAALGFLAKAALESVNYVAGPIV